MRADVFPQNELIRWMNMDCLDRCKTECHVTEGKLFTLTNQCTGSARTWSLVVGHADTDISDKTGIRYTPDVVVRQRHGHVLTNLQLLWVKQVTL